MKTTKLITAIAVSAGLAFSVAAQAGLTADALGEANGFPYS